MDLAGARVEPGPGRFVLFVLKIDPGALAYVVAVEFHAPCTKLGHARLQPHECIFDRRPLGAGFNG